MTEPVQHRGHCLCGHSSLDHLGHGAGPCDHRACGCLWFRHRTKETPDA